MAGGNVQKSDLIGALLVVASSNLHGITGIANTHEIDALNYATTVNIETRDNAFC
jgi:hypothetical protein